MRLIAALVLCCAGVLAAQAAKAPGPEWIWFEKSSGPETRYFRKTFNVEGKVQKAELTATGDDAIEVFLNGKSVLKNSEWGAPAKASVEIRPGRNVLALQGRNGDASAAAVLVKLDITTDKGAVTIVTDTSWKGGKSQAPGWTAADFDDAAWGTVASLGAEGVQPWGRVLGGARARSSQREATPADALFTQPGFKVELLRSAEANEGSWVAMTTDHKGRLIVSPQWAKDDPSIAPAERGLLRLTLDKQGKVSKREFIAQPLYDAQGLLFVDDTLYVVVNRYSSLFESGLYRVRDTGDDKFSDIKLMKKFPGNGEHGPHGVILGPDRHLYIMNGNHTKVPEGVETLSPLRNYGEDHLLPRQWDGNGHATGILSPGGYVLRTDLDGKKWELFCGGFRNAYDIAFNGDGELFTFDSDMEWDWSMPWYRPTRVNHCVSGGEYGWRSGTGKWPEYYADSLGAIDIGLGSPCGVQAGTGAKFPAKYQRALYILDWTYGRLMAVHLTPNGASYKGEYENFVCPLGLVKEDAPKKPLNLTDLTIGQDGAMYFVVGGRGVQSGLYRVTYTGTESTAPATLANSGGADARATRRKLESFHKAADPKAIETLWPYLDSSDRSLRFAARVALEAQPVSLWKERALKETRPTAALTALLALARTGDKESQPELLKALARFPTANLSEEQALTKLRLIGLSFVRQGRPSGELATMATEKLGALYPNTNDRLNRELAQLLIYLRAPGVIEKTLRLMASAPTEDDQIYYLFHLRTAQDWTLDQRREYFRHFAKDRSGAKHPDQVLRWFREAGRPYSDGASYANFMKNFYNEAVAQMPADQKAALEKLLAALTPSGNIRKRSGSAFPKANQRTFVKEWKMADLEPLLEKVSKGRNFANGRQAFVDAQCILCHKFGEEGGGVGPDLTAVASRFSRRDILESTVDPSKVVSEQFQNTAVELKDGDEVSGRLIDETPDRLVIQPNPLEPRLVEVKKADVKTRGHSKLSPMPEGLVSVLSQEDILDLLAFLESAGVRTHAAFKR